MLTTSEHVPAPVKICIECKHFRGKRDAYHINNGGTADCFLTQSTGEVNLVTGEVALAFLSAAFYRQQELGRCGVEGKFWELYVEPVRQIPETPKPKKVSLVGVTSDDL